MSESSFFRNLSTQFYLYENYWIAVFAFAVFAA